MLLYIHIALRTAELDPDSFNQMLDNWGDFLGSGILDNPAIGSAAADGGTGGSPVVIRPAAAQGRGQKRKRQIAEADNQTIPDDDKDKEEQPPPEETEEQKNFKEMVKACRKIGGILSTLLKYKLTAKKCKESQGIRGNIIDDHKEGEGLRKHVNEVIAQGKANMTTKIFKETMKTFDKWENKARTNINRCKPWVPTC